jgi:hypothetical protein
MKTILVAHRDEAFAEQLTAELRAKAATTSSTVVDRGRPWSAASAATRAIARSPKLPT